MTTRAICVSVFAIVGNEINVSFEVATIMETFGNPTLLCILGSRMFFNLKEAAEHGVNIGTNWSSYPDSVMQFDEPVSGEELYVTSFSLCA